MKHVLLLFFFFCSALYGNIEHNRGTLIVTYKTGEKGERLDRIRFWLIDEKHEQQMYPRKGTFVDDKSSSKRIVVIKNLKPGNYKLNFVIPNQDDLFESIPSKEIVIVEDKITEIEQMIKPRYSTIQATTDPDTVNPKPVITLKNLNNEIVAMSKGGELQAKNLTPGDYVLHYEEILGYSAPEPKVISLKANEMIGPLSGLYTPSTEIAEATLTPTSEKKLLPVPEGKVIVGDTSKKDPQNQRAARTFTLSAFHIGKYEITNQEFARWLNKALAQETIFLKEDGTVRNKEDKLLYKTTLADPHSEIQYTKHFTSTSGKEEFPVINVSWYGAMAYCADNNCRLPTEAEWEKAAGMSASKKYIFGFSQDTIDPSWANYRATDRDMTHFQLLTTKVGTYNGHNSITLPDGKTTTTHNAISPVGAYDMSGNVWEWVSDWYAPGYGEYPPEKNPQGPSDGTKKVVKGGCYDSTASGVRVAERMGLTQEHADPYTGFRVAR